VTDKTFHCRDMVDFSIKRSQGSPDVNLAADRGCNR